jgi:hypothetical protein
MMMATASGSRRRRRRRLGLSGLSEAPGVRGSESECPTHCPSPPCYFAAGISAFTTAAGGTAKDAFHISSLLLAGVKGTRAFRITSLSNLARFKFTEYYFPSREDLCWAPHLGILLGPPTPQSFPIRGSKALAFPHEWLELVIGYPPALPHGERTDHNGFLVGEQGSKPPHNDG